MIKFRLGFVTNSSSTNHILFWRGEKEDLTKILLAHRQIIPIYYDEYKVESEEVIIDFIGGLLDQAVPIQKFMRGIDVDIAHVQKYLKEELEKTTQSEKHTFGFSYVDYYKEKLLFFQDLKERAKGKNWALSVYFGDSEGECPYTNIGYIMDYEGRYINIDDEDLAYATQQNR